MTDQVQKIREEVERIQLYTQSEVLKQVLDYIDKVQEEPVNKDFETALAEMVDKAQKCVVEPWVVAAQWKDELIKLAKSEEPVSEPNKELAETYLALFDKKFPILPSLKGKQLADYKNFLNKCQQIFGLKEWGIHPIQSKLFERLTLLWAAWGAEHLQGVGRQDEKEQDIPVSEDLENAALMHFKDVMEFESKTGLKMANITSFKVGAQWQKEQQEEPVNENLGEYINELSKQFPEVSFAKLSRIAVRVAQWQKEQMMAKAINAEVLENYDREVIKYDEAALDEKRKLSNCNVF